MYLETIRSEVRADTRAKSMRDAITNLKGEEWFGCRIRRYLRGLETVFWI